MIRPTLILLTLILLLLTATGCGDKPAEVVRDYLYCFWTQDIGGAKALCTGEARKAIGNIHEDLAVDRVMGAATGDALTEGQRPWEEVIGAIEISVYESSKDKTMVLVRTEYEEVTFELKREGSKWLISGISNPEFGLDPFREKKPHTSPFI